jgi:hypothetical protein
MGKREAIVSVAGDKGDDRICGVAVRRFPSPVADSGSPRVGVAGGGLYVSRGALASSAAMMKPARRM